MMIHQPPLLALDWLGAILAHLPGAMPTYRARWLICFCLMLDTAEIDPSYWRDAIRQLYRTYVKRGSKEAGSKDVPDSMDEFARQREYMERSLDTLKKRAIKNEEAVKINNVKKV